MDDQPELIILNITRPLIEAESGFGFALDSELFSTLPPIRQQLASDAEGVINDPQVIFDGRCKNRGDAVLCYCARPGQWKGPKGKVESAQTGYVLMVYSELDVDLQHIVVFDWKLLIEARGVPGFPLDWVDKFGEPLWERK